MPVSELSDTVFSITPAGYSALRSESGSLELTLKTVLTLIDGICPVAQYVPFLSVFAPLHEKFQILERMGYIKRTGTISARVVSDFEQSVLQGHALSRLPRIDATASQSGFMPSSF